MKKIAFAVMKDTVGVPVTAKIDHIAIRRQNTVTVTVNTIATRR
jgi:hypothetical protein